MRRQWLKTVRVISGVFLLSVVAASFTEPVFASETVATNMVIRTIQAIGPTADTSSHELIEIHNPTTETIDVTNWSLAYTSASGGTTTSLVKITPSSPTERILLDAGGSETFMSQATIPIGADTTGLTIFSSRMNHEGGSLSLRSDKGLVVDMVGWGSAVAAITEGDPAPAMSASKALRRLSDDSNNNKSDFTLVMQAELSDLSYGNLREETDACINIDDLQDAVPEGLEAEGGICREVFVPASLRLNEVLPNPDGADFGNEFIEIYNDSDQDVSMADYYLKVGEKIYHFPDGSIISAYSYQTWSDSDIGVVFANTIGAVIELFAVNDQLIDSTSAYHNAATDYSWAWFDGSWMFTNRPTRGGANLELLQPDSDDPNEGSEGTICKFGYYFYAPTGRCRKVPSSSTPAPCKDGQYRSEETGRCRTIALSGGTLTPCKEGYYRSEETNRCRSLASTVAATLKPCRDDQFRNPETGRCKKIASTDDTPKPCQEGWERNPDTNRCRKIRDSTVPTASFPVEQTAASGQSMAMWWAVGGIGASAFAYAGWEWRREVANGFRRFVEIFARKK